MYDSTLNRKQKRMRKSGVIILIIIISFNFKNNYNCSNFRHYEVSTENGNQISVVYVLSNNKIGIF